MLHSQQQIDAFDKRHGIARLNHSKVPVRDYCDRYECFHLYLPLLVQKAMTNVQYYLGGVQKCSNCRFHFLYAIMSLCHVRSLTSPTFVEVHNVLSRRSSSIFSSFQRRACTTALQESSVATTENGAPQTTTANLLNRNKSFFPIYYNDVYEVILPPNHRFPMGKYRRVREKIQKMISPSSSLIDQSGVHCEFRVSPLATISELSSTHSLEYINRFIKGDLTEEEIRNVGFPWSPSGVDRARSSVGGTVAAAVSVCEELSRRQLTRNDSEIDKYCCWGAHVAGGTHHAFFDHGEGFCVFSDIAVAANVILERFPNLVKRILIVDLDVHQGNGNAVLFQGRDDVFTFSIHCAGNYFSDKQESDLDIELPIDCNDETYLSTLRHWLRQIEKNAGHFDFIFYQAGVDILSHDRLGRMNVSIDGITKRNHMVYDFAANVLKVPMVITMGGGYPKLESDWSHIIDAHASVYTQAHDFLSRKA